MEALAAAVALLRYEGRDVGWCSCTAVNTCARTVPGSERSSGKKPWVPAQVISSRCPDAANSLNAETSRRPQRSLNVSFASSKSRL